MIRRVKFEIELDVVCEHVVADSMFTDDATYGEDVDLKGTRTNDGALWESEIHPLRLRNNAVDAYFSGSPGEIRFVPLKSISCQADLIGSPLCQNLVVHCIERGREV